MRWLLALLVACSEPTYHPKPLPPLVAPTPTSAIAELVPAGAGFAPGERFVWEVWLRGMSVGRIELTAGEGEIRSHFATSGLASAVATVSHDLVTTLRDGRALSASERLDIDGKLRQLTTSFAGTTSQSLHTALGAIRGWAQRGAGPAFMHVVVGDRLTRVELQPPSEIQGALRVDGKVDGLDDPVALTIWLDDAHAITRIDVRAQGEHIVVSRSF